MLLKNKNAVIYGGGASLAGAVARTMAREGATIFLAGRNTASLQKVKEEIIQNGGRAEVPPRRVKVAAEFNKTRINVFEPLGAQIPGAKDYGGSSVADGEPGQGAKIQSQLGQFPDPS